MIATSLDHPADQLIDAACDGALDMIRAGDDPSDLLEAAGVSAELLLERAS
jgi:hypothetical protein